MAIENEIVRFIAEMELDPQDQAKFVEGLRQAESQCESLRKAISDTGNEMAFYLLSQQSFLPYPFPDATKMKSDIQ